MNSKDKIRGIIPPMVTPLLGQDTLDAEGTDRLVEHLIEGGTAGIFILGTTGEAQSLSYRLRREFVARVCARVAGRVPVLVGVTDTAFAESVSLGDFAADHGAAGLVAAAPYYASVSQAELVDFFSSLADVLPLPLYLYNMPSCVKVMLELPTVLQLAAHPNIAGLKDSSANMTYFASLLHQLGGREDFALYVGPEEITGEAVLMGADGGINGGANLFPRLYTAMFAAADRGDLAEVRRLQRMIERVSGTVYSLVPGGSAYLRGLKAAAGLLGLCSPLPALPWRSLDEAAAKKLATALETLDLGTFKQ
jgi:4-hydroxy-tetrahydrodipicolinate synthase